jgi:putative phosphoesterase
MKIAVISDIHDNIPKLKTALALVRDRGAEVVLCLGDLCSPFMAKELGQGFSGPIHVVFGNNDGDRFRIAANAAKHANLHFHGEYAELQFGQRLFSINHFDDIGRAIAKGQHYDVVCFGHSHRFEVSQSGKTVLINPGEIYGGLTGQSTFVVYDTVTGTADRVAVT